MEAKLAELGRMEKPEAGIFAGARKLFLVPLVFNREGAPQEYSELYEKYWGAVRASIESLEAKIGIVKRVFHEIISAGGEDGLRMMEGLNPKGSSLARAKIDRGAVLEALEDEALFSEFVDWQRCASLGFMSQKVGAQVANAYQDAAKKRLDHLAKRLDQALGPGEAGLLFISEDHKVQFPPGVEVFYVAPPALDEIHRFLRDARNRPAEKEEGGETHPVKGSP